jgi:hypothetical protein
MKIKVGEWTYDYDPNALTLLEATQLKVQTGLNFSDFVPGNIDDPRILQAVIWLARKRDGDFSLQLSDVDAKMTEIDIIPDEPTEDETPTAATLPELSPGSPNGTSGPIDSSPTVAGIKSRSAKRSA